jgi:hypothetical protein
VAVWLAVAASLADAVKSEPQFVLSEAVAASEIKEVVERAADGESLELAASLAVATKFAVAD